MNIPRTRVGIGIRPPEPEAEPVEIAEEQPKEAAVNGQPVWLDTPTYEDQLSKFRTTCRFSPPIHDVFDLGIPSEIIRLNELMARTVPERAPTVVMGEPDRRFSDALGAWKILVRYQTVQYKKLLSTT